MSECYELSLTPNYVSDWTFNDALRELIQNGIDQETIRPDNKFSIDYDEGKEVIRLVNKNAKLKISTLLLGKSNKSNDEDTVGQFGEGYKIAALVLNRLGKTFTIYNNEKKEIWTSRFKNSAKWGSEILAFYIEKQPDADEKNLVIEIGHVNWTEYDGLSDIWLGLSAEYDETEKVETSYGEILLGEEMTGKTYVNGLYVACNEELKHGYNFKAKYINLERDRKACDSWNAREVTARMTAEAMVQEKMEIETVRRMIEENANDVYNMEFNQYCDDIKEVKKMLIHEFDKQNILPMSIPVGNAEDARKVKAYGGNAVLVPSKVAALLKDETMERIEQLENLPVTEQLTLREKFQRWYDIYSDQLKNNAKDELMTLINEIM